MYIVNDNMPKDCFECPFRTKCNVWEDFLKLPINEANIEIDSVMFLKPTVFRACKIQRIPNKVMRFYLKWGKRLCRHLCLYCKHKKYCDLYNYSRW